VFLRVVARVVSVGGLCLLGGCIAPPKAPVVTEADRAAAARVRSGPFAWGISTSSYQYEDPDVAKGTSGYFYTDWDIMVDEGGAPKKGNALYSWSHFKKDLDALRKIGVTHYRFSVEWARVEPEPGRYNEKAVAGYARMARLLKESGIEPVVCIWHFTFPDWLYDRVSCRAVATASDCAF
jgi:beta-glucosidase